MKVYWGSGGIDPRILDLGGDQLHAPAALPPWRMKNEELGNMW